MKILHLNAGNETGGGMYHILSLLESFNREEFILGVFEKGELWKRANTVGIKTVHFSNKTKMSVLLIHKVADYIKRNHIRYIHTHGPRANLYASILKRFISFHWIVTVHSNPQHDFMGKGVYGGFLTKINVNAIKKADRIIIVSEPFRTNLTEIGIRSTKIITALNGIDFQKDIDHSYSKRDFGIADGDFLFLMVARLEAVKGHSIAFEAFSKILKEKRNCQLMLLGDGSLHKELKDMASRLGIITHVHFLGHRDDAACFYRMADITLLTSFSEGFPLVLLESARMKTPIITTDVGGVNELVMNHSLGWKVKSGHVEELIDAMREALLLDKKGMLTLIGESLYAHASTQFSLKAFTENIYNVYLGMEDVN